MGSVLGLGRSLGRGNGYTSLFLPGESHGQRSLVGYSPWGRKESDNNWSDWIRARVVLRDGFPDLFIFPCNISSTTLWRQPAEKALFIMTAKPCAWWNQNVEEKPKPVSFPGGGGWERPGSQRRKEPTAQTCAPLPPCGLRHGSRAWVVREVKGEGSRSCLPFGLLEERPSLISPAPNTFPFV